MVRHIKSGILLEENGIRFKTAGEITEITYNNVVWIYIRKKMSNRDYKFYNLTEITPDVVGDLVIVDINKRQYVFLENYLHGKAGELLIHILEKDDTCLAGYDHLYERMYAEDFAQMAAAREIMCGVSSKYGWGNGSRTPNRV